MPPSQLGRLSVSRLPWVPVPPGAWRLPALERVGGLPATDAGHAPPAGQALASPGLLPSPGRGAPQVSPRSTASPSSHPFLRLSFPVFLLQIKVPKAKMSPGPVNGFVPGDPTSLLTCGLLSLNNKISKRCEVLHAYSLAMSSELLWEAGIVITPG